MCLEFIQAMLDGREEPLSIRQLAKRLGYGERALTDHFPQECALITKITQEYRKQRQKQRLEQACDQVRQAMMTLHAQDIYPSHRKLRAMLPTGLMRMPEANTTWHEVLRELGLEMR
jgi:AcrR family transcriptional regulator